MLKIAVAVVLLAHGIGHSMGLLQLCCQGGHRQPALEPVIVDLTGILGATTKPRRRLGSCGRPLSRLRGAGRVVIGWLPVAWFQPLAIGCCGGLACWPAAIPDRIPVFGSVGALVIDVAVWPRRSGLTGSRTP